MACGILARADMGGIASQTLEMARHVAPTKILIVDLGPNGRGPTDPTLFDGLAPEILVSHGPPREAEWEWFLPGLDSVYMVESPYDDRLAEFCADAGVELVVHANPELWREEYRGETTRVVLPTRWEKHRVRRSTIMPQPIARDRLPFRQREQARTFLFPASPAMKDRHGSRLLMSSLRMVDRNFRLIVSPWAREKRLKAGRIPVEYRQGQRDYWRIYDDADVLVLPRRYGGLSLPIQEAASAGLAIVTLDLPPYRDFLHPAGLVPAGIDEQGYPMKGGRFDIMGCKPGDLAAAITRLIRNPDLVAEMSAHSDAWAATLDWRIWKNEWRTLLRS